jgi:hypothetical protein
MNERIRELAKQAGDYVNEVYTPPVRSKTPGKIWEDGHIDWHTQFNEKFARLIVTECCQALNPMLRDMISRGQGVDMVKQHFEMYLNEITTAMLDRTINQCEQQLAEKKND